MKPDFEAKLVVCHFDEEYWVYTLGLSDGKPVPIEHFLIQVSTDFTDAERESGEYEPDYCESSLIDGAISGEISKIKLVGSNVVFLMKNGTKICSHGDICISISPVARFEGIPGINDLPQFLSKMCEETELF